MSSFAHPKPLIRSRNSTGGDKKLTLIAFKFDDSNGEQEFSWYILQFATNTTIHEHLLLSIPKIY